MSRLTERLRKRYPTNNFGMAKEMVWRWGYGVRAGGTHGVGEHLGHRGRIQDLWALVKLSVEPWEINMSRKYECGVSGLFMSTSHY